MSQQCMNSHGIQVFRKPLTAKLHYLIVSAIVNRGCYSGCETGAQKLAKDHHPVDAVTVGRPHQLQIGDLMQNVMEKHALTPIPS